MHVNESPRTATPQSNDFVVLKAFKDMERNTKRRHFKMAAAKFALSLFAFFWAQLYMTDSVPFVLAVILAIVVHEVGHVLAMWCFGYRNLRILIVPFFGGAAMGESLKADARQQAVIALSGPILGLLICLPISPDFALNGRPGFLFYYAVVSVGINLFNLLPILPLDGGRFLEATMFTRFPRVKFYFACASAFALTLLGLNARHEGYPLWPVFPILGLVMLTQARFNFRLEKLAATFRSPDTVSSSTPSLHPEAVDLAMIHEMENNLKEQWPALHKRMLRTGSRSLRNRVRILHRLLKLIHRPTPLSIRESLLLWIGGSLLIFALCYPLRIYVISIYKVLVLKAGSH